MQLGRDGVQYERWRWSVRFSKVGNCPGDGGLAKGVWGGRSEIGEGEADVWMNARVGANFDDRCRTGRDGRVSTVCGEGIGHLGRQILMMGAECVHHIASVQSVNRGVTDLADGRLEKDLGLTVA